MARSRKFIVHQQPAKGWKPLESLLDNSKFADGLYLARIGDDKNFTCFVVKVNNKLYISSNSLESGFNHNQLGFCISDTHPDYYNSWQFNEDFCLDIWGERYE